MRATAAPWARLGMGRSLIRFGAVGWPALLPAGAYFASHPVSRIGYPLAFAIYAVGSFICHQKPERSFHLWMTALPVCARCTGIYLGAGLAAVASGFSQTARRVRRRADAAIVLAALPTIATLLYEWATGIVPGNWIRAAAGSPLGAVIMHLLLLG